jgi:hypothetical protein
MNLKAYDRATREAIIAAGQDRELFTLNGNGVRADYLIKSIVTQCDHQGEYVYAELTQVSNALLTPPEETPTTWRGPEDGLPPVGTVCAVLNSTLGSPKWERCTILYSGKKRVMYDSESCEERVAFIEDLKFRKARTPEQIKAEQREKAVAKLAAVIRDSGSEGPEVLAAYLDSHGYCKFEIVDEQP